MGACCPRSGQQEDFDSPEARRAARRIQVKGAMKVPLSAMNIQSSKKPKRSSQEQQKVEDALRGSKYSDFSIAKSIGTGSYGCVKLCRHRVNSEMCALKVTHRNACAKALENGCKVESEANHLLFKLSHPYIVRTYNTFWEGDEVFTLMELVEGGELSKHFSKKKPMETAAARVYAAEMVLALECLHKLGIIYHDLKPDNMLLTREGHIKLIDFGLASVSSGGKPKCKCGGSGTPLYMAPELLAGQSHDRTVDYWAMGITVFEFLTGSTPFEGGSLDALRAKAYKGVPWSAWGHIGFGGDTKDFIDSLLCADPTGRLSYQKGASEAKKHAFFAGGGGIKWDKLQAGKVAAPIIPGSTIDAGGGMAGAMMMAAGGALGACGQQPAQQHEAVERLQAGIKGRQVRQEVADKYNVGKPDFRHK